MISELPSPSRQSLLALFAALCVASLLSGCKPGNRTLCRSLGAIAETHDDESGEDWQIALDATLTDEDSCGEYLNRIADAHNDNWDDISLCYVRAREWSHLVTCDRVVATLDVSEVCYHRLEMEGSASSSNSAGEGEALDEEVDRPADRRAVEYDRRNALAGCVDAERVRYRSAPEEYADYAACVHAATTGDEAAACVIEEESEPEAERPEMEVEEADASTPANVEAGDVSGDEPGANDDGTQATPEVSGSQ